MRENCRKRKGCKMAVRINMYFLTMGICIERIVLAKHARLAKDHAASLHDSF